MDFKIKQVEVWEGEREIDLGGVNIERERERFRRGQYWFSLTSGFVIRSHIGFI